MPYVTEANLTYVAIDKDGNSFNMDYWDAVIRVNLRGSIDLATQILPYWSKIEPPVGQDDPDADRGAIIMVSSIVAFEGQPGMSAYAASKGAIIAAVLPMARDVSRHNIRVLSIAPGIFNTPPFRQLPPDVTAMYETGLVFPRRLGDPVAFGSLVKHIYENVYINATTIRIDGGKILYNLWELI